MNYKFRGKSNGVWVYGSYVHNRHGHFIYDKDVVHWRVVPDTVGMWTGLLDKNGKEIYEKDWVKYDECYGGDYEKNGLTGQIKFECGEFCVYRNGDYGHELGQLVINKCIEVINNPLNN